MVIIPFCWRPWWTPAVFAEPATGQPTGFLLGKPQDVAVWIEDTKRTVKPSKTSTFIRWFPTRGTSYAVIPRGKQIPQMKDRALQSEITFCVRGVISPLLANLFLHYAFDRWMAERYPQVPFERYADDVIAHCRTEAEAQEVR